MLRVELDPNGGSNRTESGAVRNQAELKARYACAPYFHVHPTTACAAVLTLTGANDARVDPMPPRTFAAAPQAASASARPVPLRTDDRAGHANGSSLDERIAERRDVLALLFDRLRMRRLPRARGDGGCAAGRPRRGGIANRNRTAFPAGRGAGADRPRRLSSTPPGSPVGRLDGRAGAARSVAFSCG